MRLHWFCSAALDLLSCVVAVHTRFHRALIVCIGSHLFSSVQGLPLCKAPSYLFIHFQRGLIYQDWETPSLFAGHNKLDKYLKALGDKDLDGYKVQLIASLKKLILSSATTPRQIFMRLVRVADRIQDCAWVPDEFKCGDEKVVPEALVDSFGGPWMLCQNQYVCRQGETTQPFSYMPHFLFTLEKPMVVFMWPIKEVISLGANISDGLHFLAKMKKPQEAIDWCQSHMLQQVLPPSSSLWIPFGYAYVLISVHDDSCAVCQPIMSTPFLKLQNTKLMEKVVDAHMLFFETHGKSGPYMKMANPYLAWLKSSASSIGIKAKNKVMDLAHPEPYMAHHACP